MAVQSFNSNVSALVVQRRLSFATSEVTKSFERLSTGLRINRASDDAAGLAIADTLRADKRLFSTALRNINDGISLLNVLDGALESQSSVVIRLRELAEQSANGSLSDTQRQAIDQEYRTLVAELGRIGDATTFNGLQVLQGSRGENLESTLLQIGIDGSENSTLALDSVDTASFSGVLDVDINEDGIINSNDYSDVATLYILGRDTFAEFSDAVNGRFATQTITDSDGNEREIYSVIGYQGATTLMFVFSEDQATGRIEGVGGAIIPMDGINEVDSDAGSISAEMRFENGARADQSYDLRGLEFTGPGGLGSEPEQAYTVLEFSGVESAERSLQALDITEARLLDLNQVRGKIGALQSRLQTTAGVVQTSGGNIAAAESRIRDVDVAQESARLVASQIKQQAAAQTLQLANSQPQLLLSLLSN